MITSTGAASACSIPAPTSSSSKQTSTSDDPSASFSDVMQQHEGSSKTATPQSDDKKAPASAAPAPPTPTAATPAPKTPAPVPATLAPGSDLSAMLIQASVLASNAQTVKMPVPPVPTTETPETPETPAPATDLADLIAQAVPLLFGTQTGMAKGSTTAIGTGTPTADQAGKDSSTGTGTGTTMPLAVALNAILGSGNSVTGLSTGKDLSASTSSKGSTSAPAKEKKSTAPATEGSFLQPGTTTALTTLSAMNLLGALASATGNTSVNQTFTNAAGAKNSPLSTLANSATSAAGTANVEKEKAMNSTLNTSATELLSASGANTLVTPKQADLQIQLASNHDFPDALKQVMHVAQLTQTAESRTPMRVEMTVQTPPGAVVNIYVSKTGDQFRAQLGTNDPVALAWVQNQITSLKSNDLGVEVKWLPPQMDSVTPTIATASSQDANLSWNQGGGQSGYQQPDERQQGQSNPDEQDDYAGAGSNLFMNTLKTAGRAA